MNGKRGRMVCSQSACAQFGTQRGWSQLYDLSVGIPRRESRQRINELCWKRLPSSANESTSAPQRSIGAFSGFERAVTIHPATNRFEGSQALCAQGGEQVATWMPRRTKASRLPVPSRNSPTSCPDECPGADRRYVMGVSGWTRLWSVHSEVGIASPLAVQAGPDGARPAPIVKAVLARMSVREGCSRACRIRPGTL